jgi:hypothetical protein
LRTIFPLDVLVIPALVDFAVTEAPLSALVPISILTVPVEETVLERFPSAITHEPEIVIFSVGRIRPVMITPLIVPLALGDIKESFHIMAHESPPLPETVPVPIWDALRSGI